MTELTLVHVLTYFYVLQQLLQVRQVVLRAVRRRSAERIPYLHLPSLLHHPPDELVVDAVLYEQPASRYAVLAFVEEHALHTLERETD